MLNVKLGITQVKLCIKLKSLQLFKHKDPCVKCMHFFGIHDSLLFDNEKKKRKTLIHICILISVQLYHLFKSHENKIHTFNKHIFTLVMKTIVVNALP